MRSLEEELRETKRDNALLLALYREEMVRRAFAEERLREMNKQIALRSRLCESTMSVSEANSKSLDNVAIFPASCMASSKRTEQPLLVGEVSSVSSTKASVLRLAGSRFFYFVDEDGRFETDSCPVLADALLARNAWFVRRSHERQMRIMEASKRRTALAAAKRTLACDLLAKRVSVHDALPKLNEDLGSIGAFSQSEMARATRRRVQKTDEFLVRRSRDVDEQNRHVDRLLAFCYSQAVQAKQARRTNVGYQHRGI
ncbi:hypothetical protein Tcan_09045 [Toxocara canis]|uniref:Uncharacterized protein n=2 Tax=Toxocara canis TaxID=6265 RepID=A0A0B2VBZ8_TOXCA|nr:hypothetical protein Tcan_09045 [Toxocara canis]VDM38255.1 unnamed protein product [Toxocara canis]